MNSAMPHTQHSPDGANPSPFSYAGLRTKNTSTELGEETIQSPHQTPTLPGQIPLSDKNIGNGHPRIEYIVPTTEQTNMRCA